MIRTTSLLLCCIVFLTPIYSQKKELKVKFGKISPQETAMTSCSLDPDAPAVILFDKGKVTTDYSDAQGFSFENYRHVRMKIFKKDAYELANIAFFHSRDQRVTDLKAVCYNLVNGQMVETELEKANVFDEKITKNLLLYKFNIPGVREGSIVEYRYTIATDKGIGFPDEWIFQQVNIPTLWSEFESTIPTLVDYGKVSQGWVPFLLAEESETTVTYQGKMNYTVKNMHFIQENILGIKPESFVASVNDYRSRIFFDIRAVYEAKIMNSGAQYTVVNGISTQYNNSWQRVGKEMLEDVYQDAMKSSKYTEATTKECIGTKTEVSEKVAAIYAYIGKNYTVRDFDVAWLTKSIENITKDKKGTPSELNILFVNMLQKAGITAWPLMLSTRSNGLINPIRVSSNAFDRVIAAVDMGTAAPLLIDVSAFPNPVGLLGEEDLNEVGLLLKSAENVDWIPVQNTIPTRSAVMGTFDIKPEGGLSGKVNYSENGYGSVHNKQLIQSKNADHVLATQLDAWAAEGKFTDVAVENADKWEEASLKMDFVLETSAFLTTAGDKYYLNPTLGLGTHENPFKNPERKFIIDLGTVRDETFLLTYNIPPGYKVEEAPKSSKLVFGENSLLFEYRVDNTPTQVKVTIKTKIKTPRISSEVYEDLRKFYAGMIAKMEEQIIFTKI